MLCATIPKDPTTVHVDQDILEMDKRAKVKSLLPSEASKLKLTVDGLKALKGLPHKKNIPFNRRRVALCKNHFQLLRVKTSLRSFINTFVYTIINEPVVPLKNRLAYPIVNS